MDPFGRGLSRKRWDEPRTPSSVMVPGNNNGDLCAGGGTNPHTLLELGILSSLWHLPHPTNNTVTYREFQKGDAQIVRIFQTKPDKSAPAGL